MPFLDAARRRRAMHFLWLILLLGAFSAAGAVRAQEGTSKEYQIKAAFLYNFVQFVKWPPDAFSSPGAPLYIGVLGDDPFNGALEDTIRGFREIAEGKHDAIPEQAFYMQGTMEEVLEKSEALQKA